MKQKFDQFVYGRYGIDQLSFFLIFSYLVMRCLSFFLPGIFFIYSGILLLVIANYRVFSRNVIQRQRENQKYLEYTAPYWDKFNFLLLSFKDKNHSYFRCPDCGLRLRAPKNKGKIQVTCSSCHSIFTKNT